MKTNHNKCVIIFSGGLDSVCMSVHLKKYDLYGISFTYGQRSSSKEILTAKKFSKILNFKSHKIIDIKFMKDIYSKTNVLTSNKECIPDKFNYSIVVPIRNVVFLSIASAWAFRLGATIVAYGAHKDDINYPDCRPEFAKKFEDALNQAEVDGIRSGLRKKITVWSPFKSNFTKSDLLLKGYHSLKNVIFDTWSCYSNGKIHCGKCESCNNRKNAFSRTNIMDQTKYVK